MGMTAVEWAAGIEDAWSSIATFVPKIIVCLLILFIGSIIAKFIRKLAHKLFTAVKLDDLVDRSGLGGPLENAGYADSGKLLAQVIYWLVMIMVIQMALNVFGPNPISELLTQLVAFIPKLIVAMIVILITGAVAGKVKEMVTGAMAGNGMAGLAGTVASAAIWFMGVSIAMDYTGFGGDIVNNLFNIIMGSLGFILVIKFGVGGIAAARDRFWPRVYDRVESDTGAR